MLYKFPTILQTNFITFTFQVQRRVTQLRGVLSWGSRLCVNNPPQIPGDKIEGVFSPTARPGSRSSSTQLRSLNCHRPHQVTVISLMAKMTSTIPTVPDSLNTEDHFDNDGPVSGSDLLLSASINSAQFIVLDTCQVFDDITPVHPTASSYSTDDILKQALDDVLPFHDVIDTDHDIKLVHHSASPTFVPSPTDLHTTELLLQQPVQPGETIQEVQIMAPHDLINIGDNIVLTRVTIESSLNLYLYIFCSSWPLSYSTAVDPSMTSPTALTALWRSWGSTLVTRCSR